MKKKSTEKTEAVGDYPDEAPEKDEKKTEKVQEKGSKKEVKSSSAIAPAKSGQVITSVHTDAIKNYLSSIGTLVREVLITINKDGLSITTMDPANVAMAILKMPKSSFAEYDVTKESTYGINLGELQQMLKRASKSSIIKFIFDEKLKVEIQDKNKRTFTLPIIDELENNAKIPELSPTATININSKDLKDAIGDSKLVADSSIFEIKDGKFNIIANGDLSDVEVEHGEDIKIDAKSDCSSKYSIEYLEKIIDPKLANEILLKFSGDYPLLLKYVDSESKFELEYILAPRVESD